ncbi:MAG: hypothetical protein A3F84_19650 [Candidatus Handelsmanbacteria bacterium RIFCSPLOWO2_12_FULL_64_10]|uniref:BD-FAE-like domain-containing protein n=1 Tax=Handelsmanbacteria sp. (strain RIFCSPLOWO2_12_FULL_64_10) TaxID=1817868 RepID=A0A1F6CAK6_HANXR|nr:MAG: hypothetical protein A3F84_19650 [Candidatus Handelsmanbacteria bacterium RIFCSPLOWO2_12_FULL_64_10]
MILLLALQVAVTENVAYHDADKRLNVLDLYLPEDGKGFPTLMWIHGGGWTTGDKDGYADLGRRFAEAGIGVAMIDYRLSPAVRHPDHVEDCARAFAWLHANIRKRGGDPARLFVGGHSAGGHLAALLTLDGAYLDELKVPEGAIKAAIFMSAPYEIRPNRVYEAAFGKDADVCRAASPISYVENATMPILVLTETVEDGKHKAIEQVKPFRKAVADRKNVRFIDAADRDHMGIVEEMARKGADPQRAAVIEFINEQKP